MTEGKGVIHQQRRGPPLTLVIVPSSFEKEWIADRITDLYSHRMRCAVATEYEDTELPPDTVTWRICERQPSDMSLTDMMQQLQPDPTYAPLARLERERNKPPVDYSELTPSGLKPLHKRVLNCVADWKMVNPGQVADILQIDKSSRFNRYMADLFDYGMLERDYAGQELIIADEGLRYLAYRDRASVGKIRKNWGPNGKHITKARKERSHTLSINELVSRIHAEHTAGRIEALPDHSAGRRYWLDPKEHRYVNPDAAILLRLGGDLQTMLLEYERRASRGGQALWRKLHVWMTYYAFNDRQYIGNVSQAENPFNLDDEVTLFAVPTDSLQANIIRRCQNFLKRHGWSRELNGSIPIAITTEREIESSKGMLTDDIWLRIDDFQLRKTNPILSERRRASPRRHPTSRRK